MTDILLRYTFFATLLISLLIVIGLGSLYSVYATRHKILSSPPPRLRAIYIRRRVLSLIGVILLVLGISCFVEMLLLRLTRYGTLNTWTLGFVIEFVLETCLLAGTGFYAARRSIRTFIDRSEPLPSWKTQNGVIAGLLLAACCLFLLSGAVGMFMIPFIIGGFILAGLAFAAWIFFKSKT